MELDIPGYDIIERIGAGGMASVYRANQHTFQRDVALKVLRQDLGEDEKFCERFIQESLIVAKLHHSHIVQVYDVGEYKNLFYVAMEFLSGGNLSESMQAEELVTGKAVKIFSDIASALDYSHQKGIVHRDVKPDNIMFREDGAAVLTDFGIAKDTDATMNLTQTGTVMGTPKYMSPEQIRGAAVGPQSDLYSLGIVFYQMLTGAVPYSGSTMVEVAFKHLNEPIPQLPQALSRYQPIIDKLLAKNPDDRFARGKDILAGLERRADRRQTRRPAKDEDQTVIMGKSATQAETQMDGGEANPDDATIITNGPDATEVYNAPESTHQKPKKKLPIPAMAMGATALVVAVAVGVAVNQPAQETTIEAATTSSSVANAKEKPSSATIEQDSQKEIEKTRISQLLASARLDETNNRLTLPEGNNALSKYQQVLTLQPVNEQALSGLSRVVDYFVSKAEQVPTNSNVDKATEILALALKSNPENAYLIPVGERLTIVDDSSKANTQHTNSLFVQLQIQGLLKSAEIDEKEGRINDPKDNNAVEKYRKVLGLDPDNSKATERLQQLGSL